MIVKFYGGPWHRETRDVEYATRRIEVRDTNFRTWKPMFFRPEELDAPIFPEHRILSYEIDIWHERRGNARREMLVGVLEGRKNMLSHEEHEIEWDLRERPWEPCREVSFLKEFDRWWNWLMYRRTGNQQHLHEEFYRL